MKVAKESVDLHRAARGFRAPAGGVFVQLRLRERHSHHLREVHRANASRRRGLADASVRRSCYDIDSNGSGK